MNGSNFFAMGGYGLYVWCAYGAAALILAYNIYSARRRERNVRRELQEMLRLNQTESE
jgi:heme exporter protein D